MSVRVDASQAINGLLKAREAIAAAQIKSGREAAQSAVNGARSKVHVITGKLRNSIRIIEESPARVRFGSDIYYAGIEEFRPGHSYIMPEYNRLQTYYPETFMRYFRSAF